MAKLVTFSDDFESTTYQLAPFGKRAVARIIDLAIVSVPIMIAPADMLGLPLLPVAWLYWAIFQSSQQQATVGQRALGIRVISKHGNRVNFLRATHRHITDYLNIFLFPLPYMMFFLNKYNQCAHDYLSNCLVIEEGVVEMESEDHFSSSSGRSDGP